MNIILKVLEELDFLDMNDFSVEYDINSQNSITVNVKFMISQRNNSQVFLIIECADFQLIDFVDGKLIKEIAVNYRKNEYHRAEMDKNTTLLLMCKHMSDGVDFSSKVKIEDDPYYFKKYVFSYNDAGIENAEKWLNENAERGSVVTLIQEYISDTVRFAGYKENKKNELIYEYFMELVTKLHCFPMKSIESKNIKTVTDFLYDEIQKLRDKSKDPIDINLDKMEKFIELDIDYEDVDDICLKWDSF